MPPRRSARLALLPSPGRERGQGLLDVPARERGTRTVPVPVRDECDDCGGPCLAAPSGLDEYVAQNCSFARREWQKLQPESDYLRDKSSRIIFRTFARDCFERSLVEHCKSSRYRAVTWLMHLVDVQPESVRESFFRSAFCMSSYPKTSAKLARDVDLLEFVFRRQNMNDLTLEDVKFAHGILGQDFTPSRFQLIEVVEWDAIDALDYLIKIPFLEEKLATMAGLEVAMLSGSIQCMKRLHDEFGGLDEILEHDIRETAKDGHVECLRYAIENGAQCDARALLANPDIQDDAVVQYLRTLLANSDGNTPGGTDPVDALRRAQSALDDVSDRIPEGTYLQMSNALGEVHRRVRPRRGDD